MSKVAFSEFTFAVCLLHELLNKFVGEGMVPLFLTPHEEKLEGHDLELAGRGSSLFLQFKLSHKSDKRSNKNIRKFSHEELVPPIFRCALPNEQFKLMLNRCTTELYAYYAAPLFASREKLVETFQAGTITNNTAFIRPESLTPEQLNQPNVFPQPRVIEARNLSKENEHSIRFDANRAYILSKPNPVRILSGQTLLQKLSQSNIENIYRYLDSLFAICSEAKDWYELSRPYADVQGSPYHQAFAKYQFLVSYFRTTSDMEFFILKNSPLRQSKDVATFLLRNLYGQHDILP